MKYLHQNDIIHSHLNPRNILIDDDFNPKITDFYFNNKLDIKTKDNEKARVLHYSCQSGNIDLVKYLIYLNKTKIMTKILAIIQFCIMSVKMIQLHFLNTSVHLKQ